MAKRDYYEVLGISKGSTKKEIKSAYRKLAKKYHPDRNKEADAEKKFKEVQESYDVLYDDQKRKAYDQYGHAGTQGFGGSGSNGGFGGFSGFEGGGINDIFEQFFGGGFGGFSSSARRSPTRGQDISTAIRLTFNEAVFGTKKILKYKRRIVCETCVGTGAKSASSVAKCQTCKGQGRVAQVQRTFIGNIQTVNTCPTCQGEGEIIKEPCEDCNGNRIAETNDEFEIKIPQGIPDGVTLKFREKGHSGDRGGTYGDLYIEIEVESHEGLERRGNDIYSDVEIDVVSAVLGTEIEVLTVHGDKVLKIPQGTQPETIIKMSKLGGPKFRGKGNGDHYVRVMVKIPKRISKEQRILWESLRNSKKNPGFIDRFI